MYISVLLLYIVIANPFSYETINMYMFLGNVLILLGGGPVRKAAVCFRMHILVENFVFDLLCLDAADRQISVFDFSRPSEHGMVHMYSV